VVGERERAAGTVTLRRRGVAAQVSMSADELERRLLEAIRTRSREPPPP
jgi:threonyl-tRNA synthetase